MDTSSCSSTFVLEVSDTTSCRLFRMMQVLLPTWSTPVCKGTFWNLNTDLLTSSLADNIHSCTILSYYIGFTGV